MRHFFFGETAESRRRAAEQGFNQFELKLIFSALLECTSCRETVACCGQGEYVTEPFQTGPDGEEDFEVIEYFSPHYFSHPMRILHIPFQVPPAIDLSIRKSFRLVFCDPGAAANHIRQCAETILATAGIAHVTETGKFIPFEQRIQKFEDIDPENADRVSALRWIGNFGSHPDKEITRDDVFEAYDILEILLEDLYVGHTKSVRKRVEEINKARGPR